jgi:hypothetical protein
VSIRVKFQAVAGAKPQRSQQQLRLGFRDPAACIRDVFGFAANNHVRLRIKKMDDALAKKWMLFQD